VSSVFDTSFVLLYDIDVKDLLHPTDGEVVYRVENRIKEYREKYSFSQGKLAELCNVSRQTINAIENNKYDPSLQLAFDIARNLGITVENLFIPLEDRGK